MILNWREFGNFWKDLSLHFSNRTPFSTALTTKSLMHEFWIMKLETVYSAKHTANKIIVPPFNWIVFIWLDARLRKKKKWQVILPLAILGKLMHLKMMVFHVLVGVAIVQVTLLAGGIFLFHYLKHNALCSYEPHLIHSHSHILESAGPGNCVFERCFKFIN